MDGWSCVKQLDNFRLYCTKWLKLCGRCCIISSLFTWEVIYVAIAWNWNIDQLVLWLCREPPWWPTVLSFRLTLHWLLNPCVSFFCMAVHISLNVTTIRLQCERPTALKWPLCTEDDMTSHTAHYVWRSNNGSCQVPPPPQNHDVCCIQWHKMKREVTLQNIRHLSDLRPHPKSQIWKNQISACKWAKSQIWATFAWSWRERYIEVFVTSVFV